eukprot:Nitzschia sp. Nitz4//scaffold19_size178191//60966//61954//NITZ4_001969-RA/size178191-processed-gene-0.12-mRNA-1//1//CDS//3329540655//588//frame0
MTQSDSLLVGLVSVICLALGAFAYITFSKPKKVFPQQDFKDYPLIKKEILSHDVRRFTFGLPPGHVLGLPTGQHVALRYKDAEGKFVQRSYTPVSDNSTVGELILVVKVYMSGVHPKFPDGGKMSQHLDALKIGDTIEMKGPKGHMEYLPAGKFHVKPLGKPLEHRQCNQIIMIAGGTGITPMLQVLHFIFRNPGSPNIHVKLLYANQAEEDILCRQELEALVAVFPDRFSLHYTLDRPPEGWKYSTGFVNKDMLEKHCMFPSSPVDTQVFMCGPPPMIKFACQPNLKELGFTDKEMVVF